MPKAAQDFLVRLWAFMMSCAKRPFASPHPKNGRLPISCNL
ncbi:MAG: hypothetical protein AAF614_37465 [Chloroflexota bacterium]